MTNLNYRKGSIIRFHTLGEVRMVLVESKGEDIKNDGTPRSGFNLLVRNGDYGRGYDDQIIEVVKF